MQIHDLMENSTSFSIIFKKNSTFSNETTFEFIPNLWICDVIICSFFAAASLYLLTALIHYVCKKLKRPSVQDFLLLSSERKYRLLSFYTCIVVGFVSMFRHVCFIGLLVLTGQVVYNNLSLPETTFDTICNVLPRFDVIAYGLGISLVMLLLWLRQATLHVYLPYNHRCFKSSKADRYVALILIISYWVVTLSFYIIAVRYRHFKGNCLAEINWNNINSFEIFNVLVAPVFAIQLLFLSYFTATIVVLRNQQNRRVRRNNQFDQLKRKATKVWIIALFCMVTDVIFTTLFVAFHQQYFGFAYFPFSINLVINHLATIAFFDCWKTILWPWNLKFDKNGEVDEEVYRMTVFPSDARRTMTDPGAHTSIREPRSSPFG